MSAFGPKGLVFVAILAATLTECASTQSGPGAQGACEDNSCGDGTPETGAPAPTYDAGGSFSSGDSGTTYWADGGGTWSTDGGLGPWGDAASPSSDGGFPLPWDGGFQLPGDGGAAVCNPLDPKYASEFAQALASGLPTPCSACVAGECCYSLLGCVPL
jgi:hypothetical protein